MIEWTPSIPGIDLAIAGEQRMKHAVLATMAALDKTGAIHEADAAEIQSLIISAEMIDRDAALSKSTVAGVNRHTQAHAAIVEFIATHAADAPGADWDQLLAELTDVKDVAL